VMKPTSIHELTALSSTCYERLAHLGIETTEELVARPTTQGFSARDIAELKAALGELGQVWSPLDVPFEHAVERLPLATAFDPAPTLSVAEIWSRIEVALAKLGPKLLTRLGPPASEDRLRELEALLGLSLPADLCASYAIHDGSTAFVGDSLLTLDEIAAEWNAPTTLHADGTLVDDDITSVAGPVKAVWWSRAWIPILADGAGNLRCVDLDPDAGGDIGQIVHYWHDTGSRSVIDRDFKSVLAALMTELETRHSRYGEPICYYEHEDGTPYLACP